MKVAFAENNVLGSQGLQQTGGFKIAASGHAFKMLSSGLYSDKVRAVLREIGCNAMDAHIAVGDPNKPFRVKLPNTLDDQFYVQDWGPGLAHEDVMGLYTTYFASTKQSSNDFTGAFGLGSKSPFSYTDSFSVVSVHGDRKRTYSLYLGNDGSPQVSLMAEEETDAEWKSGVRVGFAVQPGHVQEFVDKAQVVYQWFRVPPEMRGCQPIKPVEYKYTCDDFSLMKEGTRGDVTALMGNVAYPLNLKELGVKEISDKADAGRLVNYAAKLPGLTLRLAIGDAQVAASRESLQYDPKTVKVLKQKLELAVRRAGKEAIAALEAAADGGWAQLCAAGDRMRDVLGGSGITWEFDEFAASMGVDRARIPLLSRFIGKAHVDVPAKLVNLSSCYVVKRNGRGTVGVFTRDNYNGKHLDIHPETAVLAGATERAMSRAKRAVEEKKYMQVLVVARPGKDRRTTDADIRLEAAAIAREMGGLEVKDLADYLPFDAALAPRKKKKKKGWMPTLPDGVEFECLTTHGADKLELKYCDPIYICKFTKSRWHNSSDFARVFEKTLDDDVTMDWATWTRTWSLYAKVQEAAKLPDAPNSHAVLTVAQVKSIALPQLGWTSAHHAIAKYLARPDLQVELRKTIKRRHLAAAESIHNAGGWMSGLSWALGCGRLDPNTLNLIDARQLRKPLQEMVDARKAAKSNAVQVPGSVVAYQQLARQFSMQDALATDVQQALTVEDRDTAFAQQFPRAALVDIRELFTQYPTLAQDAIQYVLSKEA